MKKYILFFLILATLVSVQAAFKKEKPATKAELGKLLFFDPILSSNRTISCASCHKPAYAFADTSAVSLGVDGRKGNRNTPSAMNLLLQRDFFWDGRAKTLEDQALAPVENPDEMNLPIEMAVQRLNENKEYVSWFMEIFKSLPTRENLAQAIAAFERTLETSDSPFDNWKYSEDSSAVSAAVKRGFIVFNEKGKCVKCHFGSNFTTNEFRNIGLFDGKKLNDSGRVVVSGQKEDIGKFRTPGLRNVALTSPYMHNGMFRTLTEVIEFYNDPAKVVPRGMNRDTILAKPLGLTKQEKNDLEKFLISLTDRGMEEENRKASR
jgi:cytochrome c peroxidase